MDTILLSNMLNHIIHISNYLIKQLKNINILLITFSWSFSYIFINFDQFYRYFFQNIRQYISDISYILVKSKYQYIRDYGYFHPCLQYGFQVGIDNTINYDNKGVAPMCAKIQPWLSKPSHKLLVSSPFQKHHRHSQLCPKHCILPRLSRPKQNTFIDPNLPEPQP